MNLPLRLEIRETMAVHSADVELAGLTVLCGANSTGKTTIARVLKGMIDVCLYSQHVRRQSLVKQFEDDIVQPFFNMLHSGGEPSRILSRKFSSPNVSFANVEQALASTKEMRDWILTCLRSEQWRTVPTDSRYYTVLCSTLGLKDNASHSTVEEALLTHLKDFCDKLKNESPIHRIEDVSPLGNDYLWKGSAAFFEKGEKVWVFDKEQIDPVNPLASVDRVFYIESPYATRWMLTRGNLLLTSDSPAAYDVSQAPRDFSGDEVVQSLCRMMQGRIEYKTSAMTGERGWMYVRDDGKECPFNLAASGIRSLANIFRLYTYGLLDNKSILILDEPEAHLHPSWVVAYAELLVRLVRKDVRILLASHSPDMVNALKSFALAADLGDMTNFYYAKDTGDGKGYDFEPQALDVGNIFDSFNTVYEQIETTSARFREGI